MGSCTDEEYAFYVNLGYSGSLNDMRLAYVHDVDMSIADDLSVADTLKRFYAQNAIEIAEGNLTDLTRDYYASNSPGTLDESTNDLRLQKFEGSVERAGRTSGTVERRDVGKQQDSKDSGDHKGKVSRSGSSVDTKGKKKSK